MGSFFFLSDGSNGKAGRGCWVAFGGGRTGNRGSDGVVDRGGKAKSGRPFGLFASPEPSLRSFVFDGFMTRGTATNPRVAVTVFDGGENTSTT